MFILSSYEQVLCVCVCLCVCGRRGNGLLGILDCFCMISNTVIKSLAEIDTFVVLWTGKCVRSFVRPPFLASLVGQSSWNIIYSPSPSLASVSLMGRHLSSWNNVYSHRACNCWLIILQDPPHSIIGMTSIIIFTERRSHVAA